MAALGRRVLRGGGPWARVKQGHEPDDHVRPPAAPAPPRSPDVAAPEVAGNHGRRVEVRAGDPTATPTLRMEPRCLRLNHAGQVTSAATIHSPGDAPRQAEAANAQAGLTDGNRTTIATSTPARPAVRMKRGKHRFTCQPASTPALARQRRTATATGAAARASGRPRSVTMATWLNARPVIAGDGAASTPSKPRKASVRRASRRIAPASADPSLPVARLPGCRAQPPPAGPARPYSNTCHNLRSGRRAQSGRVGVHPTSGSVALSRPSLCFTRRCLDKPGKPGGPVGTRAVPVPATPASAPKSRRRSAPAARDVRRWRRHETDAPVAAIKARVSPRGSPRPAGSRAG